MGDRQVFDIAQEIEREEQQPVESSDILTLSNGVVLRAKKIPPMLANKLNSRFVHPPVPVFYAEDKARAVPNYNDPQWMEACQRVDEERGTALMDLMAGLGTEIISLPPDVQDITDTGWADDVETFLETPVPEFGRARHVAYMKYYILIDNEDWAKVARKVQAKMGVSEEEVAGAMDRFRGEEKRQADSEGGV